MLACACACAEHMYFFCQRQLGVILSLQMPQVLATDLWVFVSVRSAFAVLCNLTVLSLTSQFNLLVDV